MIARPQSLYQVAKVTAFVDWNSQIHAAAPGRNADEYEIACKTLNHVGRTIALGLRKLCPEIRYDVTLRVYHGWHRGFQATPRRIALTTAAAGTTILSDISNVFLRSDVEFGDRIIAASDKRLHIKINCHVPNTLRKSLRSPDVDEEKMVDTAIACDVVDMAYREPDRWLIILGEDDDLIPPLIAADGIRGRAGGRVALIRRRSDSPFFKIEDIRIAP